MVSNDWNRWYGDKGGSASRGGSGSVLLHVSCPSRKKLSTLLFFCSLRFIHAIHCATNCTHAHCSMLHIFMLHPFFSINGIKVFAWLFTTLTMFIFSLFFVVSIVCLFARTFLNGHEINLWFEFICAVEFLSLLGLFSAHNSVCFDCTEKKNYSMYVVMTMACLSNWFVQQIIFFLRSYLFYFLFVHSFFLLVWLDSHLYRPLVVIRRWRYSRWWHASFFVSNEH